MTSAQNTFYFSLWGKLKKAQPDADRHAVHAQLGLPASHKDWGNAEFDRWKGHCLAQAQPANVDAQLTQIQMPAMRRLVFIGHLLTALEMTEMDAEALVVELRRKEGFMRWNRRKMGGRMTTLQTLPRAGLDVVRNTLKDRCRARWGTKEHLLGEIHALLMQALNRETLEPLTDMKYEDLLLALSALRSLAAHRPWIFAELMEQPAMDVPF